VYINYVIYEIIAKWNFCRKIALRSTGLSRDRCQSLFSLYLMSILVSF